MGVNRDQNGKKINPRWQNGNMRRKRRARMRAMDAPCHICGGKLGPIHYDEPSDSKHPLSFVIDEIKPISRYREWGYRSAREAAEDPENVAAAHYWCNQQKKNKTIAEMNIRIDSKGMVSDGDW